MTERLQPEERHESMRGYFSYELHNAMVDNPDVWLITADLGYGVFDRIRDHFPDRFVNVGAAEQAAVLTAVGLAQEGKIPFVYSITPFLLYRPAEAIRNYVNREQAPVKLIGSGRNSDYAHDGFSHYAGDDKALLKNFPNIQSCWPLTKSDMKYSVNWCVNTNAPIYLNLSR